MIALGGLGNWPTPSRADTNPPAGLPATVSTDPLPTAQINGVVWTQLVVGNKVYVGGEFTRARPAGAAPGTQEVVRNNLLAYDITTGVLDPTFAPSANAQVRALAASPDGSRVYAGGNFTSVNGSTRNRVAVFSTATGALLNYTASANSTVLGLAATASTLYLAGPFSNMNGTARTGVAALDANTGAVRPFSATPAGGNPRQIVVSPDQATVMVGGNFTTMNGSANPGYGLAALDAVTGATKPMPVNSLIRNGGANAAILSMSADQNGFYGAGYRFGGSTGNLEGAFKADWNGNLIWVQDCHGDTYSVAPVGNEVYVAGHPHYCGNLGSFPQTSPNWTFQRGLAFTQDVRGTVAPDIYGYYNYDGRPRPQVLHFLPDINVGTYTGQSQGPWSVTGNANYVLYGGEFTQVNFRNQQGLVRFARSTIAPNDDGPRLSGANLPITAQSFAGVIRINLQASWDRDNEMLSYELRRNGTVVDNAQAASAWWRRPWIGLLDTGVTAGQSYTYEVRVSDPRGNTVSSATLNATASGGRSLNGYDRAVLGHGPQFYWPMDETSGSTASDLTGRDNANVPASVVKGRPGISSGGTSFGFSGSNSLANGTSSQGIDVFSTEAWFRTTSVLGGKIIGFGNFTAGSSSNNDRHIYLTNNGRVRFGATQTTNKAVGSDTSYNDGQWHHVVGTLDATGLKLYVDGVLTGSRNDIVRGGRYSGYWRIGGDRLSGWPDNPTNGFLIGDVDQAAVYNRVLLPGEVAEHWSAGSGAPPANQAPTASFTASTDELAVSVNGSASSDPDGSVVTYAWQFGDGGTGSGATASHTFATPGTYTVRLTVTDDDGVTGTTTRSVTVDETPDPPDPAVLAADEFARTLASGWGSADMGGPWTLGSATSGFAVADGSGKLLLQTAASRRTAYLPSVSSTSSDVRTAASVDKIGAVFWGVYARRVSASADYRVDVNLNTSGKITWTLYSAQGGGNVKLGNSTVLPGMLAPGDIVRVRIQADGQGTTTVRAKVWIGSEAAEPAAWGSTVTDTFSDLQQNGSAGTTAYLSGGATNAPIAVSIPSFQVTDPE